MYPKETNLILGLCFGAAVGLSQKIAVRRQITLAYGWVWGEGCHDGLTAACGPRCAPRLMPSVHPHPVFSLSSCDKRLTEARRA